MNNQINKRIWMSVLMMFLVFSLAAQDNIKIEGVVYNALSKKPLPNVQVASVQATGSVITDENGVFSIEVKSKRAVLLVKGFGFIDQEIVPGKYSNINVYLLPTDTYLEGDGYNLLGSYNALKGQRGTAVSIRQRDLNLAYNTSEEALYGKVAGLRVISKGGMPGEGAAIFNRGIRSLTADNTPLIVIDGMPYLPMMDVSPAVNGFSRNIFLPTNIKGTGKISFLKGADAAMYGSMGSNGVLLIDSEDALDLKTSVEFQTVEGVSFISKRLPLLNAKESKNYLADVGENKYSDPAILLEKLPFLSDDPDKKSNFLYMHDTDWQDEIYKPSFTSENVLKVKGGDAVAKYMFTVGTQQNSGVFENTHLSKYFTRLNANVNFSRRLIASIGVALNYSDYQLQEQGLAPKTNPLLASLYQAPFMSVQKQSFSPSGKLVDLPFFNPVHPELEQSNPVAILNGVEATSRSYNIMINMGLNYKLLSGLQFKAMFGLYYDQNKDDIFIPGRTFGTIAPLRDSLAINTARSAVTKQLNYYGRLGLDYEKTMNDWSLLHVNAGGQLLTSQREYDAGEGANTPTDFYTTLDRVTFGRLVHGDMQNWNWMNFYLNANYSLARQLYVGSGVTLDGASSYGSSTGRWFAFPFVKGGWCLKESNWLKDTDWLSELTLRGEYAMNGNSRFSSKYGKYSFISSAYLFSAGLHRTGLPNSKLEPEKVLSSNIGLDFSMVGNRISFGIDLYREQTKDAVWDNPQAAFYGFDYRYDNSGEIDTKGVEVNLRFNVLNKNHWNWMIGGNIAHFKSEIVSLGNEKSRIISLEDGAQSLLTVGESPYLFYGYKADKIFYSTDEVLKSGYMTQSGERFEAGDVKFCDMNGDKYINEQDKVVIGDPTPDFYGAFYSNLNYKNWNLFMNFTYSYGNDIYNGVRRSLGAMDDLANQDRSVARRWLKEGQETDIPRASYGDPHKNNRFSSRWIEDGSYLRLKEVTLSYSHTKKTWLFNSIKVYVTGENLLTFTNYLGMDPEFSYSYDPKLLGMDLGKMPLAKNVKVGLVLNF